MRDKLLEILSDVWHRSISADEGLDAICDLVEQSAEIARLEAELAECRNDAERYRWLRDNYHGFEHYRSKVIPYVNLDSDIDQAIAKGKEE